MAERHGVGALLERIPTMNGEKHTAIYVRVSTKKQEHKSQLPDLKRWTEAHDGPIRWYRDTYTGKVMDRPAMDKVMEALHSRKLERIVVWRLDRLGRTARGLCELFDTLRERKIDLVSLRDGFNLNTAAGRMYARILASVAEYETELRAERVRAGQAVAREKGIRWIGSKPGWRWKVTDDQVNVIARMRSAGQRISMIARTTGLSRNTIYATLENHPGGLGSKQQKVRQ